MIRLGIDPGLLSPKILHEFLDIAGEMNCCSFNGIKAKFTADIDRHISYNFV